MFSWKAKELAISILELHLKAQMPVIHTYILIFTPWDEKL